MKNKTLRLIVLCQIIVVALFLVMTVVNEIFDVPHYVFADQATLYSQRAGEILIELLIFLTVLVIQIALFRSLYKRIRILEGFIPICASCKKIRTKEDQWQQMEEYISLHSLAQFSHSICPDCAKRLYPDYCDDKQQ